MAKVGRKSAYEEKIKDRFEDIKKWLQGGATEEQVAEALEVSKSVWFKYKAQNEEFRDFIKSISRKNIVLDLRSALIKKALGFTYTEKKTYKKRDEDGHENTYVEINEKYAPPDVAAINLALKNYDRENWANDPQMLELKKQELELKKQMAEADNW